MNCRETRPLLPLFFDGELEARQMRAVALHSTRCLECENELRHFERLQDAVATHISTMVGEVDLGEIWAGVAPRLESRAPSLARRLRARWEELQLGWSLRGPAFAAVAAAVLLTLALWQRDGSPARPELANRPPARDVDNSAVLGSVSSADSVALVTDEETNTTLLWIMDDTGAAAEPAVDELEGLK
jgi:anti-sigma factor RsiW